MNISLFGEEYGNYIGPHHNGQVDAIKAFPKVTKHASKISTSEYQRVTEVKLHKLASQNRLEAHSTMPSSKEKSLY